MLGRINSLMDDMGNMMISSKRELRQNVGCEFEDSEKRWRGKRGIVRQALVSSLSWTEVGDA